MNPAVMAVKEFYYSRFSSGDWTIPSFLELGGSPDIYVDPTNNELHLTWCSDYNLRYWYSATQTTETIPGAGCDWYAPVAKDGNGTMHVIWKEAGQIYESVRLSEGWSEKANISQSSSEAKFPDMVADENGGLHVVWQELHNGKQEIFYTYDSTYDCSGITLSSIAQAVRDVVAPQNYCGNHYEDGNGLITLPPGEPAFERFSSLAQKAHYEIDFTNMIWDANGTGPGDSPGIIFLTGLQKLAINIQNNPGSYPPDGVHVRILLGLKEGAYGEDENLAHHDDQRLRVLDDLQALRLLDNPKLNIEVALYRDGEVKGNHSHAKMMIVDGQEVIASGYNMQYSYLKDDNGQDSDRRDTGLEVSGPIAANSLQVFDKLWLGAKKCDQDDGNTCTHEVPVMGPIYHHPAILNPSPIGNDVVFSLYRDGDRAASSVGDKTADEAIVAAIESANMNVNIMQDRFMNAYGETAPYARAILDALEKEGSQVNIKLLVTKAADYSFKAEEIFNTYINTSGICGLEETLRIEDQSKLPFFEAKYSKFPMHTKALSIDNSFVIVGSQNFDVSAFGDTLRPRLKDYDLAEYSLAIDSTQESNTAADDFDSRFMAEWDPTNSDPVVCASTQVPLQSQINQATAGSIIFIPEGIYNESITIDKPLVLVGSDSDQTMIQATNNEPVLRVASSDVTIMNMKISGSTGYGIELVDSSLSSPRNIQINNVVFENNAQGGVLIQGLTGGSPINYTIENNTFIGGADGITIDIPETQVDASIVRDNIFSGQSVAPIHILSSDDSHVEYSYNLFNGCGAGSCVTNWHMGSLSAASTEHDNLFDLDPLFVDAVNGDYQLSAGSPAIDAGDPSLLNELLYDGDNDGTARIDIGAFEAKPLMISGNLGIDGATLSYTDGSPKTATSDINGSYSFTVPYNWSGTVTPSKAGYIFTPPSVSYTNVTADQTNQDYIATPATYTISGNAGVGGATLSYVDGTAQTATANSNGDYSFTVSYYWSGTVTPSKAGYTFTPTSRTYNNISTNQSDENYTVALNQYTISGNSGVEGATLSYVDGTTKTVTANASGDYSFTVPHGWSGTVTPLKAGYTFAPSYRTYSSVSSDQMVQNYTATLNQYIISGNAGVAGATLSYFDGTAKTATANAGGDYSFTVPYGWSGTVTPSKAGYTFTPPYRSYTNVQINQTGQNYTTTLIQCTSTISGNAGVASAILSYTGGTSTADGSGNYSFTVSYPCISNGWSGTVTPSKPGYTFTPPNRIYTNVQSNQTGQNYTATAILYTISGNAGVAGATLSYVDGTSKIATADAGGNYSFTVLYGWSGTVTPSKICYTFTPAYRSYTNVLSNQPGQNYTVQPCDDTVGVFRSSNYTFSMRNSNTAGAADIAVQFGLSTDKPVVGDWDGNGTTTIGTYRNGTFYLRNSNSAGFADNVFAFGQSGDQPIAGDWNGDGIDTIGVFRPSTAQFLLRNSNSAGSADMSFGFGPANCIALAGDWNGDGIDTIGVFYTINGYIYLRNSNTAGGADITFNYGAPGDKPLTGDWNSDGIDTIGVYRANTFYLRNSNTIGFADIAFQFGNTGDQPIAGNWDGIGSMSMLSMNTTNVCVMTIDSWDQVSEMTTSSVSVASLTTNSGTSASVDGLGTSLGCDVYISTNEALEQGLSLENLDILTESLIIEQAPAPEDGSVNSDNR